MATTEEELIQKIASIFPRPARGLGIGDDAALYIGEGLTAVTNDLLVEDVDFTPRIPKNFVAKKAIAANLSDLAAMGAEPRALVLGVAFPSARLEDVEIFLHAFAAECAREGVDVIGGDLSRAERWFISVTAIGNVPDGDALLRSGAKAGEQIFVSRPLGGSAGGLKLLARGWTIAGDGVVTPPETASRLFGFAQREFAQAVIRFHVAPEAEARLGMKLSRERLATSCIDVSDGLSTDLNRLCVASGIGAEIDWEKVPMFPDLHRTGFTLGIDSEKAALHGGEEFALLFTSPLREFELSSRLGRPVYAIGRTTKDQTIRLVRDGKSSELRPGGYDHFV